MKILITGGSGFIGSHVVEHYQDHAEVVVLDNLRTGRCGNLDGLKCRFVEGSILDRALLDELMAGVDYGFHLAAMVSVPESMALPGETVDLNVHGLQAEPRGGVAPHALIGKPRTVGRRGC
jgi:UDP-glucose 4-epimerase